MRGLLLTAALTIGLAPLAGCGEQPKTGDQAKGGDDKGKGGDDKAKGGDDKAKPDPKLLAELDSARGAEQDFVDYLVKAQWADARGSVSKGFYNRLVGILKDEMWAEEALAKLVYFSEVKLGGGFVRDKAVADDKKFDKGAVAASTLLAGGEEALFEGELTGGKRKARFVSRAAREGGKWKIDAFVVIDSGKAASAAAHVANDQDSARALAGHFLDLVQSAHYEQAHPVCSKEYLKKLMGIFDDPMWAEEALAKLVYFPDKKVGEGFVRDKEAPEEKKLDGYTVKSAKVNGDEATVEGEATGPKRKADFKLKAIKEGGKWRVNGLTLTDK